MPFLLGKKTLKLWDCKFDMKNNVIQKFLFLGSTFMIMVILDEMKKNFYPSNLVGYVQFCQTGQNL